MAEITPLQCKTARTALNWRQADLAAASRVNAVTIRLFETGQHTPKDASLMLLRMAFEKAGVVFLEGDAGREGISWRC